MPQAFLTARYDPMARRVPVEAPTEIKPEILVLSRHIAAALRDSSCYANSDLPMAPVAAELWPQDGVLSCRR
jgi:hypothetical protein